MGLIKEPKGVTFTVGERRVTKDDEEAFSSFFKKLKAKNKGKKKAKTNSGLALSEK